MIAKKIKICRQAYCGFSVARRRFQSPGAIGRPLSSNPAIIYELLKRNKTAPLNFISFLQDGGAAEGMPSSSRATAGQPDCVLLPKCVCPHRATESQVFSEIICFTKLNIHTHKFLVSAVKWTLFTDHPGRRDIKRREADFWSFELRRVTGVASLMIARKSNYS